MLHSYSQAVIRYLLTQPAQETAETARQWRKLYPQDPERAAIEYAGQLSRDFKKEYLTEYEDKLMGSFMRLGLMRTNWRMVAEYLLDRFAPLPENQLSFWNNLRVTSLN